MKTFTEIGQFRNVVKEVRTHQDFHGKDENGDAIYLHNKPYPTLIFRGTVKNHGTNSAIVKYKENNEYRYVFQSRERELTIEEDNSGFMKAMISKNYHSLFDNIVFENYCAIYGEWCGQGIQKNVAIAQLPKMFIIFAVKIDDVYQDMENFKNLRIEEENIFNILQFKTYSINIDFNNPELVQNILIELTTEVEKECPVGKHFFNKTMTNNIAYEENGKIWFDNENGFTDKLKPLLIDKFKKLRKEHKNGINYIKFTIE